MNVMAIEEGLPNFESGAQVFLVADAQILEQGNSDRAAFENDDKATVSRGIPNIVTEKEVTERTISSDGRRMTVYVQLSMGRDGIGQGTIGTLTLRAQASYVDQYDSRTNKVLTPRKASRDVRITLKNIDPATTFRKN